MPLEVLAVALCVLALLVIVAMLLVALADTADPTTITRCQECAHWMINTRHRPDVLCFRCRHHFAHSFAVPWHGRAR